MTIVKEITDLAWNVPEEEYRDDKALSYSTLARYEKGGFSSIPKLFEPVESDSLLFGSIVDTIMTEGDKKFDEKFCVTDSTPPEGILDILKSLSESHPDDISLDTISDEDILSAATDWNARLKPETKLSKIKEAGSEYFSVLQNSKGKTLVDNKTYLDALDTVRALRTSPMTSKYFGNDTPAIKKYYQVKFKTVIDDQPVRCMFDLIIVNYEQKWIMPIDLKTTSFFEYEFYKRYLELHYDIQARLYWRILKQLISQDDYFKDFELYKFQFVCVNRFSKLPMSWYSDDCDQQGTIKYETESKRVYTLRDPIEIAKELQSYLDTEAKVPNGIELKKSNNIQNWIKKI